MPADTGDEGAELDKEALRTLQGAYMTRTRRGTGLSLEKPPGH